MYGDSMESIIRLAREVSPFSIAMRAASSFSSVDFGGWVLPASSNSRSILMCSPGAGWPRCEEVFLTVGAVHAVTARMRERERTANLFMSLQLHLYIWSIPQVMLLLRELPPVKANEFS